VPRGRYKIFLGMAAGVGKTYRMLQEGRAAAEDGRDVVIGYLEPHDRPETAAQAEGLEMLPRRTVEHRGTQLQEMDLPGLLERHPDVALIDELAHTNAPGLAHEKRYEDIEDVLDAGIDVLSTVNVQHLDSLNDRVAELTGTRMRETFPDWVLNGADEVMLVDLTPQGLIQRLREGRVYPPERVEAALGGFFKIENLETLRQIALREVAEEVEAKRVVREVLGTRDEQVLAAAPQAVGERLLALVTPRPRSQRLVRRAWRSAQRLGADLDLLYVSKGQPSDEEQEQLRALRKIASLMGAHMLVEHGDNVAETATRVARERGTTYILVGEQPVKRGFGRLRESLPEKLIRMLPGVDVRLVSDRARREEENGDV
jgi:two-component system sensor histidine kinase KdpD